MPGTNLVGPYGEGVNEVYGTPDLGDSGGTEFSWYADCSSDVADDGTKWTARWANRIMMQLRQAVVGMGITLSEIDGDSLLKAIRRAHRPIVNIGGGAQIHKGEKMPEWQHELRTLVGGGAVSCTVVDDTIVISAAGGGSETPAASIGTGHPIYKGVVSGTRHFRSLLATHGLAVVANPDDATVRLAAQPGWSIMLRNAASADAPTGVAIDELTELVSPAANDWLMLQRNPGRELRKIKVSALARRGLYNQGMTTLASDALASGAVISGAIATAGGPSTINFQCDIVVALGAAETSLAAEFVLEVNHGAGWVAVKAASPLGASFDASTTLGITMALPICGVVVDAPGAVQWRVRATVATTNTIKASSSVTWLQFA